MDHSEQLKSMLQDIINDKHDQASVTMHDYFVSKTREVSGLGVVESINEAKEVDKMKPMLLTTAMNKLLKPAIAAKLSCSTSDLVFIRSSEYGDVSAKMEAQYEAIDSLKTSPAGHQEIEFMLKDPDMDDDDSMEDGPVSFDIYYVKKGKIKFASFGLQEGGPSYTSQFMVKKSELAELVAMGTSD